MAWSHPWPHSWQKWRAEWKYQRAWRLKLRLTSNFFNILINLTDWHRRQYYLYKHTPTGQHLKDISTPPVPGLPCESGCWGWGSTELGGPWGQTCWPASPSWPPLLFFWRSQSSPGCLTCLHRPLGGHLYGEKTTEIILIESKILF